MNAVKCFSLVATLWCLSADAADRPNVVLIMADDMDDRVSCRSETIAI
ncbi:MAG: hypothetical protein H0T47_17650 [Planctomycetaceae bacterium]|nr:hypothetical protein [Planctomycetaceae bacterium]